MQKIGSLTHILTLNHEILYVTDGTGDQMCQVELRFLTIVM